MTVFIITNNVCYVVSKDIDELICCIITRHMECYDKRNKSVDKQFRGDQISEFAGLIHQQQQSVR